MDIRPRLRITPSNLYGNIDTFEIDYATKKDSFLGTFISRTLTLKLVGIEESSIPTEIGLEIAIDDEDFTKMPNFVVMSYNYDSDKKTATIKGNDYGILFDRYFNLDLTYPLTLSGLASAICGAVGVNLKNLNFANDNFIMEQPKIDSKYTFREIIGMIASAMGGIAFINNDDELEFKNLTNNDLQIVNIFEQSVDGEKIGPIKQVQLAREPITDVIRYPDEDMNGDAIIKITNNYLLDDNREGAIIPIYNILVDAEFYPAKINTYQGYKVMPFDIVEIMNKEVLITNINIKYPLMFDGFIGSEQLSKVETKHNTAKGIEQRIVNAEAKVDKIEGNISLIVEEQTNQANNIDELENNAININNKITQIIQNASSITNSVQFSGGTNKVKNSVGLYEDDLYEVTDTSTTTGVATFGEVSELKQLTGSGAMIFANNKKVLHTDVDLLQGQEYTLTFKYSNVQGNNFKFAIINTEEVVLVNTTEEKNLEEVVYTFVATGDITYYLESNYLDDTKGGFITDLIIKEGNLRSNWEPAQEEFMGTSFSIYYNGIKITSDNSNIQTVINNLGFSVVDKDDASKIILAMDNLKVILTNTVINGTLTIEDFIWEEQIIDNDQCLFLI